MVHLKQDMQSQVLNVDGDPAIFGCHSIEDIYLTERELLQLYLVRECYKKI